MGIMMDTSRDMQPLAEKPQFAPDPLPEPAQLYFRALAQTFQQSMERLLTIQENYLGLLKNMATTEITKVVPMSRRCWRNWPVRPTVCRSTGRVPGTVASPGANSRSPRREQSAQHWAAR
jgi:hypothetical protein